MGIIVLKGNYKMGFNVIHKGLSSLIFLIVFLSRLTPAYADSAGPIYGSWYDQVKFDAAKYPEQLFTDSETAFSDEYHVSALLLATGIGAVMHTGGTDDKIADYFTEQPAFDGFWDGFFDVAGSPGTHIPGAFLWYVISAERGDLENKQKAWTMLRALSLSGTVTVILKIIVHNDCPNGKSLAWPSGHTASSFTLASVLPDFYGDKVGIPAYIGASLVAYRMMDTGDHWASDIIFGATLGLIVGHTIARGDNELEIAGMQIVPFTSGYENPVFGIGLLKQF
jgi:membrane-associated phospholipid phosphatase